MQYPPRAALPVIGVGTPVLLTFTLYLIIEFSVGLNRINRKPIDPISKGVFALRNAIQLYTGAEKLQNARRVITLNDS
jgi:hypothetical protein